jgi:hypothetical protein
VKSIVLVVPLVDVDVLPVLVVPVDDVVVALPAFLDFADFVVDVSALASLVPPFVVVVGLVDGALTGFADAPVAARPCVVADGP